MTRLKVSDEELRKVVMALRHPAADVRATACFRLETIGGPVIVNKLIGAMREAKATDWLTVFSLAALGKTAYEPLLAVLSNPQAQGRAHAATALGLIDDRRAVGALLNALQDRDPVLRSCAVAVLGHIGDECASEMLVMTLRDPKVHVRRDAMQALSELGDRRAVGLLIRALRDPSRFIRMQAAECPGEMGRSQALPELQRLVTHEKRRRVKQAVWQAIEMLERQA